MTPRENFSRALRCEPITGHVPHFELVFFLTMESIGRIHPIHRNYGQWYQMSQKERNLHLRDMALAYVEIAEKYHHSAIFVHPNPNPTGGDLPTDLEVNRIILEEIREISGDKYFLMIHGDPTFAIPTGDTMMEFTQTMYEEPQKLHQQLQRNMDFCHQLCEYLTGYQGLYDGYALCSDYCFNANPFYTGEMFDEFVAPYLRDIMQFYRSKGLYSIKHSDGNIMPILQQILDCQPDAIHSLDPQGGVNLLQAKEMAAGKVCLIGNVNCGLLQTGTDQQVQQDVRRSLQQGMPGYGYIFSTSNCAFTGLSLERYEMMHSIWRQEGIYAPQKTTTTNIIE